MPPVRRAGTVGHCLTGTSAVTVILASRPNVYTGSPLDRVSEKRDDAAWVAAALEHPDTLFAPVWRARNLMRGKAEGRPCARTMLVDDAATLGFEC